MLKEYLRRVEGLDFSMKTVLLRPTTNWKRNKNVRDLLLLSLPLLLGGTFILLNDRLVALRNSAVPANETSTDAVKGRLQESYGRLPLSFE